jgi:membrane protease YdiL (CAAX protease family)
LYSALQRTAGPAFAVGLVTFLFAIVHLPQYYPSVSTMILLTLLSLTLTLIRVKTGNLLPCIILHTIFNGFQSILLIIEPYVKIESTAEDALTALIHTLK